MARNTNPEISNLNNTSSVPKKKADNVFLALAMLKLTWNRFNLSTLVFWEKARSGLNSQLSLFSKLNNGQNRLKIWTLACSYDRKISKLHFLCSFYFILNSLKPFFRAFSESSASSQKMNLLKIIAHFWPILDKIFFSHFRNF